MTEQLTTKISSKGQVVIPVTLRRLLNLQDGDKMALHVSDDGEIILKKLPTALDWRDLIADIPSETVDITEDGQYDPEKAPNFHDWMTKG